MNPEDPVQEVGQRVIAGLGAVAALAVVVGAIIAVAVAMGEGSPTAEEGRPSDTGVSAGDAGGATPPPANEGGDEGA